MPPGGEQQSAVKILRGALGQYGDGQCARVGKVVQHQQRARPGVQRPECSEDLLIAGPVVLSPPQAVIGRQPGEAIGQRTGRVDPEDAIRVVSTAAVDVFDGELGFTNMIAARSLIDRFMVTTQSTTPVRASACDRVWQAFSTTSRRFPSSQERSTLTRADLLTT
jgi:hypothetical protein